MMLVKRITINSQIKFKTSMEKSSVCDYSDAYILVGDTITITWERADDNAKRADEREKGVIFKDDPPFTDSISKITSTQTDIAKDMDFVMSMSNLIEYRDNYSKTSGTLQQYYNDEPHDNLTESESCKSKVKITVKTPDNGNKKMLK